jgi:N-glycosylase/DNA lyase
MMDKRKLVSLWNKMRPQLKAHVKLYSKAGEKRGEGLFAELAFCLFTPQSKAFSCWAAIETLQNKKLLMKGSAAQIAPVISAKGVRFKNNKARYLVEARSKLCPGQQHTPLHKLISSFSTTPEARDWLADNIKGLGLKEASHFLRNIGLGDDIAILDRHILKNLVHLGVIDNIPTLSKKNYLDIETRMKAFSKKIRIPMAYLDLLLWYNETGALFK